jgi:hypothetical protein
VDDEFLRDYLVVDFAGNKSPTANSIFAGKTQRSVNRNSSEIGRAALGNPRLEALYTKGGIFMGDYVQAPVDPQRFNILFKRIVGGLYFHYSNGGRIPVSYPAEVLRIMPWDFDSVWQGFQSCHLNRCGPFADVFAGACARVTEDLQSTLWLVSFYERVHFQIKAFGPHLALPSRKP